MNYLSAGIAATANDGTGRTEYGKLIAYVIRIVSFFIIQEFFILLSCLVAFQFRLNM